MSIVKHEPSAPRTKAAKKQPQPATPPVGLTTKPRERFGGAADYGQFYWCVKTDLSDNGEIYLFADEVRHQPNGGVLFVARKTDGVEIVNLALAAGQWEAVFAASCFDGHAVAVEQWEGEIRR